MGFTDLERYCSILNGFWADSGAAHAARAEYVVNGRSICIYKFRICSYVILLHIKSRTLPMAMDWLSCLRQVPFGHVTGVLDDVLGKGFARVCY